MRCAVVAAAGASLLQPQNGGSVLAVCLPRIPAWPHPFLSGLISSAPSLSSPTSALPPCLQDPSGGLARAGLQAVVDHVGHALGSPHTWQHRELRNPLGDAALPPLLPLSQGSLLAVQGLANHLLLASLHGQQCVRGVLLLYGPYLLWSSLAPRDTAALFAVVAAGLLHASSSSKGGSGGGGGVGEPHAAASAAAVAALPSLRALDGGAWRQLPSGFLVLRGSADAPGGGVWPAYGAPTVPLVHLQHSPDEREGEQGGAGGGGGQPGACRLLPLLEGRLLVGLLLDDGALATPQQLAGLHGLVAAPARQLAAQVRRRHRQRERAVAVHPCLGCERSRRACPASPAHRPAISSRPPTAPAARRLARRCVPARRRQPTCPASATCTRMRRCRRRAPLPASRSAP